MSSPLAFDTVMILAEAIQKAGSTDPVSIRQSIEKTDYFGATGQITFDENGDPTEKTNLQPLDFDSLATKLFEDEALALRILDEFINDLDTQLNTLHTHCRNQDYPAI